MSRESYPEGPYTSLFTQRVQGMDVHELVYVSHLLLLFLTRQQQYTMDLTQRVQIPYHQEVGRLKDHINFGFWNLVPQSSSIKSYPQAGQVRIQAGHWLSEEGSVIIVGAEELTQRQGLKGYQYFEAYDTM